MKCFLKKAAILCVLMMATSLGFTQTFVQSNTAMSTSSTTTLTIPFTTTQVAGNLNVIAIGWTTNTAVVSAVTDTRGNTYTLAVAKESSGILSQTMYYAKNIAAGSNTITVTFSPATAFPDARIIEYSGLDKVTPLDVIAHSFGNSASPTSGSPFPTTNANDLIVGAGTTQSGFSAPGTGFTSRIVNSFGNMLEDKVVSVVGSYPATGTTSAANLWVMQMVALRVAVSGPTATAINPTSGPIAGGTPVTITGTGFVTGATATIGGVAVTGLTVVNSTTITATTGANTAGVDNVVVTVAGLSGTLTGGYTYSTPQGITFIQSATGPPTLQTSNTTISATYPLAQTAGNFNVIAIGWKDATSVINSVTDIRGNTYIKAVGPTVAGGLTQSIYYAKNIAGFSSNTVTVVFNKAAASPDLRIAEYSGIDGTNPLDVVASASGTGTAANSGGRTYTTNFPLTENPISEGGNWINGGAVGLDWGNVTTTPGKAVGNENLSISFGDSTATLADTWGPDQTVQGTVYRNGSPSHSCGQEIELHLRQTTTAHSNTGYEISYSSAFGSFNIVKWLGPSGSFTVMYNSAGNIVANGDIIKATIVGNVITAFRNGTQIGQVTDNSSPWTTGGPGMGLNYSQNTGCTTAEEANYGLSSLTASDSTTGTLTNTANELIFGAGTTAGAFSAAGTGFTSRILNVFGNIAEDKFVTTIASYNTSAITSSANWIMQMATFRQGSQVIPAPTVTSISPNTAIASGNVSVTITGTGFSAGATVAIGGVAAINVVVASSTSITATIPAHATGVVNVVVTNADTQSGTLTNGFTYTGIPNPAPTVSTIVPASGPASGGTSITITGTGFLTGATVTLGAIAATNVVVISATSISANVPAHAAGAVNVVVTNTDAQSKTVTNGFTYIAAPTIASIAPTSGTIAGLTSVTITGTGFLAGATVQFGGISATSIVVVSATSITAKTPADSAIPVTVTVTNTDGQIGTLVNGYTYTNPAPTVTDANPAFGFVTGGTGIVITGTGFLSGAGVTVGGVAGTSLVLISSTSISFTVPAHAAGVVDIVVTNTDSKTGTFIGGFTYLVLPPTPTIGSISPTSGGTTGGDAITITGTNFLLGATVSIGGTLATSVVVVNPTTITAITSAHSPGILNVVVTNPNAQTGTLVNGFTQTDVVAGTTSMTKSSGAITISGAEQIQNTVGVSGTAKIIFSGTCVQSCGPLSATVNNHTNSISYVQGANAGVGFIQTNSTQRTSEVSVPVLYTKAQTAGNLNIVVVKWNGTPSVITSVTDTNLNSYGLIVGPTLGFGVSQAIYYANNILAAGARANTVNVTFDPASRSPDVQIYEYSGLGAFDVGSKNIGTTNPSDSGSVTTNFSKEMIFGAGAVCGAGYVPSGASRGVGFIRPGSGFLQRQITPVGDLGEDKTVFAIGRYNASGFVNCSGWVMQLATFWAGVTANNLATNLAAKINADRSSSVTAKTVGSTVFLTSKAVGPTTNYNLSIVTCCNIQMGISGSTLTGGTTPQVIADTGVVSVFINSIEYSYNYSQIDIPTAVAAGLTNAINSDPNAFVTAVAAGATINLVSKSKGDVNYPLAASSLSSNPVFGNPSFNPIVSGPTMTGGSIQHSVSLVWPASVSPNVVGYNVYRSTTPNGPYTLIAAQIPALTYNDTTVLSGSTYFYVITSVDNLGNEGVFSHEVSVVIPFP